MSLKSDAKKVRKSKYDISSMFLTRWSPRAMSGESLSKKELMPLFEAARWAPSSFNGQPWRFLVAHSAKEKELFRSFLIDFNKEWCKNASALVIMLSRKNFSYNNKPNWHHSFDSGAAWMSCALEGAKRGLVVHGMAGFDKKKLIKKIGVPKEFEVNMMFAIGKFGNVKKLPENLAKAEKVSLRMKLSDVVKFGKFDWK